jgi:hypothetical protein
MTNLGKGVLPNGTPINKRLAHGRGRGWHGSMDETAPPPAGLRQFKASLRLGGFCIETRAPLHYNLKEE